MAIINLTLLQITSQITDSNIFSPSFAVVLRELMVVVKVVALSMCILRITTHYRVSIAARRNYIAPRARSFLAHHVLDRSQPLSLLLFLSLVELKRGGLMEQLHPVNSRQRPGTVYTYRHTDLASTRILSTLSPLSTPQFCSIDRRPEYIGSFSIISLVR